MRTSYVGFCLLSAVSLGGCAHQIQLTPGTPKLGAQADANLKVKKNVGYVIPDVLLAQEVTTAGGGGDKVRYFPYKDMQAGIDAMLGSVFDSATKITSARDANAIAAQKINLVITPTISTDSSSPSAFTWPPTQFSVELTCQITDADGTLVDTKKVTSEGHAEFDEFKSNHGLAGQRAAEDALAKMRTRLRELAALTGGPKPAASDLPNMSPVAGRPATVAKDLERLKSMFDQGILTPGEYEKKRKELVDRL